MNVLHLGTLDTVFLIIAACAIALFFILGAVVLFAVLFLISKIRKVVIKAEDAIGSVEDATATIRNIGNNATGPLALFKIIKRIIDLVDRK